VITDIRAKKPFQTKLTGHRQEICGLKFNSFDYTLASGGNDNKVIVWDGRGGELKRFVEHKAAIKA
jgi:cell division cycle 20-like protein 1 (cofactor of APC complex)